MRSAQSRLGLVSSLGAARRNVGRCVEGLPFSVRAAKVGVAALSGLTGAVLLRGIWGFGRRRKTASVPQTPSATLPPVLPKQQGAWRYVFTQALPLMLIPLCRHYLLGERTPVSDRLSSLLERLLRKGH